MKAIKDWLVGAWSSISQYFLSAPSRIVAFVMLIVLLGGSAAGYCTWKSFNKKISKLELKLHKYEKGKKIGPGTVVTPTETVSKEKFEKLLKADAEKDKQIKKLLRELQKGKRTVVTRTRVKVKVVTKVVYRDKPSDSVKDGIHTKKLLTKRKLHIATVKFNTKKTKKPWSYETFPLRLRLHIFHSVNPKKPDRVGVDVKVQDHTGKEVPGLITNSKTTYTYPKHKQPTWSFGVTPFRLELYGLLGAEVNGPSFSGGFGLASHLFKLRYGSDDVFRFLGLGIGYNSPGTLHALVYPISYNLGSTLPLISDLFITVGLGPGLNLSTEKPNLSMLIMFGLGTTL
jgi:hypothetical protein